MSQLTPKLQDFYNEIQKTERNMPPEAFILFALTSVAKVAAIDRLRIQSRLIQGNNKIFANIYALLVAPSGSGKDLMYSLFRRTTDQFIDDAKQRYENWRSKEIRQLGEKAEADGMSARDILDYVRDNSPRSKVLFEIQNGTPEGLMDMRVAIQKASLGGIFIYHSEFAQVFDNNKQETNLFLEVIKEGYEGTTGAKVTRHVEVIDSVRDVPMNMLAYTAPIDPNNEYGVERFLQFLLKGYARRMHFCMPSKTTQEPFTFEEMLVNRERQSLLLEGFEYELKEVYKSGKGIIENIVTMQPEAEEIIYKYQLQCEKEASVLGLSEREKAKALEITGRYWRAFKMSGVIAVYEHPYDRKITVEDVRAAIWITEKFAGQLNEILNNDTELGYKIIFNIMLSGKEYIRTDLYGYYRDFGIPRNDVKKFLDENIPLVEDYAPTQGYELIRTKLNAKGGGESYKLKPLVNKEWEEWLKRP